MVNQLTGWKDTGRIGNHGRIYQHEETGELAEEYEGSYLVELELIPQPVARHDYLLEQEYGHDNHGW